MGPLCACWLASLGTCLGARLGACLGACLLLALLLLSVSLGSSRCLRCMLHLCRHCCISFGSCPCNLGRPLVIVGRCSCNCGLNSSVPLLLGLLGSYLLRRCCRLCLLPCLAPLVLALASFLLLPPCGFATTSFRCCCTGSGGLGAALCQGLAAGAGARALLLLLLGSRTRRPCALHICTLPFTLAYPSSSSRLGLSCLFVLFLAVA
mmetsp:Transcript_11990/g.25767  ORF Transcript_11990/g.25767 Transcript_11990/m.25767 type:complete len:207 (-) Transcript_11990:768-1388(-)